MYYTSNVVTINSVEQEGNSKQEMFKVWTADSDVVKNIKQQG